jgi:LysM repeat protein
MNSRREVFTGIIAALVSITIIGGSLAVATAEEYTSIAQIVTKTPTLPSFPTHIILVTQRPGEPTFTPSPTQSPSKTATPSNAGCQQPVGWSTIILKPGDTLDNLAQTYNTTHKALKEANCLISNSLIPGTIFYVPGAPLPTEIPCGPPWGWIYYIVQPGDTLYSIGRAYGVSVAQLQAANCLGSSTTIRAGQKLYVPNVQPIIPSPTPTSSVTATPIPSNTPTSVPTSPNPTMILPSATPTPIPTSQTPIVPTETLTTPTEEPIPTDTNTPNTPAPTSSSTPNPEPTSEVPTDSPTGTPDPTETFTPEPTETPNSATVP